MKYFSLCLALLLSLSLAACNQSSGEAKIAVVDMNVLQGKSKLIQDVTSHLEAIKQALLTEALAAEDAYQSDPTPENDQMRQQAVASLQGAFGMAQQSMFTVLREQMDGVLEAYRVEHGLSLVVLKDTVLAMDPALDATDDILAAFDAKTLDLNTLAPIPETAAPEQAVEAAPTDEAPAAETPASETPASETPASETPASETPAEEAPAEEAPAEPAQ